MSGRRPALAPLPTERTKRVSDGADAANLRCPRDLKFINGLANVEGWNGTSANSGTGSIGACCTEMDIWEANTISAAYTPHPCTGTGLTACTGDECDSTCDQAS